MPTRFVAACLISAGVLLAGGSFLAAADAPSRIKLVTKVYPVADLVIPLDNATNEAPVVPGVTIVFPPTSSLPAPMPAPATQPAHACKNTCPAKANSNEAAPAPLPALESPVALKKDFATCPPPCPAASRPAIVHRKPMKTTEDTLIKLVTNVVAPQSWSNNGGDGRIDYYGMGMAIVVTQTPDVQEQIAELLDALRRLQDVEVALEVRFVTVTDKLFERASQELGIQSSRPEIDFKTAAVASKNQRAAASPAPVFLNDRQAFKLMQLLQTDRRTSVMQAPKLTVFNGMESTFSITSDQSFVTNVNLLQTQNVFGPQAVFVPQVNPISSGFQMSIRPAASPDRRYLTLNLNADQTSITKVDLFPITTFITPIFEGGAVGQPIPFTQFIQQPKLTTVALHKSFCVPDGGTVLLSGWNTLKGPEREEKPLMVEILDNLCPPPASARETETVVLMVTPRIIVNEVEEARVPVIKNYLPSPKIVIQEEEELKPVPGLVIPSTLERVFTETQAWAMHGKVCDILASYQRACSEGRLADARELAKKALAIDPACFSQNLPKNDPR